MVRCKAVGAGLAVRRNTCTRSGTALALAGLVIASTWAVNPAVGRNGAAEYVEGEVIVTFKPAAGLPAARQALAGHGLQWTKHFAGLSAHRHRHTGLVRDAHRTTAALLAELQGDPAVETAEPNYLRWFTATPNDPLFPQLWALQNTGQTVNNTAGTAGADIRFPAAWSLARPATGTVVVAVLDSGVDYTHPDLASNMWVNPGEIPGNGLDDDGNGYVDDVYGYDFRDGTANPSDSGYHGTHVAGTIAAAGNNQQGVIGVNYQARIMALRASNDGNTLTDAAIIEGLQYAVMMKTQGVNIVAINMSFGGGSFSSTEQAAIQAAGDAGIVACVSAGNDGSNNDTTPVYPASYHLSNMLVVAASEQHDSLASFSNYGATSVDLAAPGVNILSAEPVALGGNTFAWVTQGAATYSANAMTYSGTTTGLTAAVVDCGLGYPSNFPAAVSGNIALIKRGTLTFADKVTNAMAAGARAAVIDNNVSGNFFGTLGSAGSWIPAVSLSLEDGVLLRAALPATGTVACAAQNYQFLEGTSMAAPHVAGAVAFAARNFPGDSVTQRVQRILANVDHLSALQGKVVTGGRLNLLRTVDSDTNNLPDWWEGQYFGHLGVDLGADPDHDGLSNLQEYLAGTEPTNAASVMALCAVTNAPAVASNGFAVSWWSVAGRTYTLTRSTNLLVGFTYNVRTNIPATPPANTEVDTNVTGPGPWFYRVRLE